MQWLTGRRARQLEPGIAPGVRGAIWAPGDHQVDNRLLVGALLDAAGRRGCCGATATAPPLSNARRARCRACAWPRRRRCAAGVVVLAAGSWSAQLAGLPAGGGAAGATGEGTDPAARAPRAAARLGPTLTRTVRGIVHGSSVYVVPRHDRTVVVGATVEERGFDAEVTAGAVYELLRDAHRVVPGITEMALGEASAGLRPGSPDNAPMVGPPAGAASTAWWWPRATTARASCWPRSPPPPWAPS